MGDSKQRLEITTKGPKWIHFYFLSLTYVIRGLTNQQTESELWAGGSEFRSWSWTCQLFFWCGASPRKHTSPLQLFEHGFAPPPFLDCISNGISAFCHKLVWFCFRPNISLTLFCVTRATYQKCSIKKALGTFNSIRFQFQISKNSFWGYCFLNQLW